MSDFKDTPAVELTTAKMMERYQLEDEKTLRCWAKLHGINTIRGFYYPNEVDLIDHAQHHVQTLGMSIKDYQNLIDSRIQSGRSPTEMVTLQPKKITDDAYDAIQILMAQYSEAIDVLGEQIADRFIDELDLSVMQHLSRKVKVRLQTKNQAQPNRLIQTIKAALKPQGETLLVSESTQETNIQLEYTNRLG